MSCLHPTQAWQDLHEKGSLIWSYKALDPAAYFYNSQDEFVSARYKPLSIPCGKCILCRKSRAWEITIRSLMEFQALPKKQGCFVTLTVSDEFMSEVFPGLKLKHKPFQDFMKRLRRKCERELYGFSTDVSKQFRRSLRYLMCGEYGEHTKRPHFHICFFGVDFTEKHLEGVNVDPLDRSSVLPVVDRRAGRWYNDGSHCDSPFVAECWPFGQIQCRSLNDNAIAYTAGYQLKLDGELGDEDYEADPEVKLHNYVKWSRRPGLGFAYMQKYPSLFRLQHERCSDGFDVPSICPSIIYGGKQVYFDGRYFKTKLQLTDPAKYERMRTLSEGRVFLKAIHNTYCDDMVKASNLKNRAELLSLQLARKSRDCSHNMCCGNSLSNTSSPTSANF